ncbi:MAG: helix-turn-helix domain-containing protein [Pseudomonadota bacterium]
MAKDAHNHDEDEVNAAGAHTLFRRSHLMRVGAHLRSLRQGKGLSLRALAEQTGLSVAAVRGLEAGEVNPSLTTVLAIADAIGADLDRIVETAREDDARVSVRRTSDGAQETGFAGAALGAVVQTLDRSEPLPSLEGSYPTLAFVVDGCASAETSDGERYALNAGDTLHGQPRAITSVAAAQSGGATLLRVVDRRRPLAGSPVERS